MSSRRPGNVPGRRGPKPSETPWMLATPSPSRPSDPASLAAEVRALATHAHHAINLPAPLPAEARALLRRIDRLRSQVRGGRPSDLADWLENLRREVDARLG